MIIFVTRNTFPLNSTLFVSKYFERRVTYNEKLCSFIPNFQRLTMSTLSEEKLIENIRTHTSLYDIFSADYIDQNVCKET